MKKKVNGEPTIEEKKHYNAARVATFTLKRKSTVLREFYNQSLIHDLRVLYLEDKLIVVTLHQFQTF